MNIDNPLMLTVVEVLVILGVVCMVKVFDIFVIKHWPNQEVTILIMLVLVAIVGLFAVNYSRDQPCLSASGIPRPPDPPPPPPPPHVINYWKDREAKGLWVPTTKEEIDGYNRSDWPKDCNK